MPKMPEMKEVIKVAAMMMRATIKGIVCLYGESVKDPKLSYSFWAGKRNDVYDET